MGNNHISATSHKVTRPTQADFLPDHPILEGVVVLHETIDELHRKNGVILKIDYKKAYYQFKWPFLQRVTTWKLLIAGR